MSPRTQSNPTEQLLEERKVTHGNAHELAGMVIEVLREQFIVFLYKAPQLSHNWVLILSKLIRVLFSPYNVDHWQDIIGYATLALRLVEKGNGNDPDVRKKSQSK